MPFVSTASSAYLADDLAKFIDLPSAYRGQKIRLVPLDADVSKNGITYFPFKTEEEVSDWIGDVVSEWWDDETI